MKVEKHRVFLRKMRYRIPDCGAKGRERVSVCECVFNNNHAKVTHNSGKSEQKIFCFCANVPAEGI